jgi:hypothetical protein
MTFKEGRPMRRRDRVIDEESALELLEQGQYGVLSTVGPQGVPYGVPISYVLHGDLIVFHSALEGRKLENIATSPRASFCVVGETEVLPGLFSTRYQSTIAEGVVRELLDDEKLEGLRWLADKFSPEFKEKAATYIASLFDRTRVFALQIESVSGKRRR